MNGRASGTSVEIERDGPVAIVTIRRPARRNAGAGRGHGGSFETI